MFGKKTIYSGYSKENFERLKEILEERGIDYKPVERNSANQIFSCAGDGEVLREQANALNPDIQYELIVDKEHYKSLKKEGVLEDRL